MNTLFDLSGRVALVTGASRGLGFGMAQGLARAGAHVVLSGRDPATLQARCAAALRFSMAYRNMAASSSARRRL